MMPNTARRWIGQAAIATLVLLCAALPRPALGAPGPGAPRVLKVEPPNWWVGMPLQLMLLLSGENLEDAEVITSYPDVRIARVETFRAGRYVFAWLDLAPETKPGRVPLELRTAEGSTVVELTLDARRSPQGSFQGLTADDVLYLIMPDRFADGDTTNNEPPQSRGTYDRGKARAYHGGDLRGIQQRLPYLRDLGVTALWLNPIYDNDNSSPNDYHGYGAVDYYAVDEHFGTLRDVQELVAAAHQHGIKIFLDNVPNHSGPRHPWAQEPPLPDWFHGARGERLVARSPFEQLVDPHAPPKLWRDLVEGWFAGVLPDLNTENPHVAQYMLQNSIWWAEQTGLDGYRLDTFPYLDRRFWAEWHRELFRVYAQMATIGEVFHGDPSVTSFFAGGRAPRDGIDTGVTTVFDFPFYFALRDVVLRDAPVPRLVGVFQRDWLYPQPEKLVTFLGNHDVKRLASEAGASKEKQKLAFSLLLTVRGIPQLYTGDEIGMQGGDDPDNRRDFPGGFPGDPRNAFTREGRSADEEEIFSHVQALLRLRREHPALRGGEHWQLAWDDTFYAFARISGNERLLVVFHNGRGARSVRVDLRDTPLADTQSLEPLFSAQPAELRNAQAEIPMAPGSLAVYRAK